MYNSYWNHNLFLGSDYETLIAVDMEGISGITGWNQVTPENSEYSRGRHLMTADVNAAITGAVQAGVDNIVVTDGHWFGTNILIEELSSAAHLISGTPSPLSMVQGVQDGVDAVIFIGFHARIGTTECHPGSFLVELQNSYYVVE